jgi:hypothetical protein
MLDLGSFRDQYPHLCPPGGIRVPGLAVEDPDLGEKVRDWKEAYERLLDLDPWREPPIVRPLMKEQGTEAFGHYVSFRLEPDRWGLHLRGVTLIGLSREILRVLKLGFRDMEDSVPVELSRELAFRMAFDIASNHLSFHASVDAFAAAREVEDGREYYAPYMQGPYTESLEDPEGELGYNLEEALGNVVALRSFLNPGITVEMGSVIQSSLNEDEQFRWNAYLMSGSLTTEIAYIMRVYPPGYRNFTEFLRRRGEVGPYAHMAVQYDLDTPAFEDALRRLARLILQGKGIEEAEKEILKPVEATVYLIAEG